MARAGARTAIGAALILLAGSGWWVAVREPDFARISVETLTDLERELDALRIRLRIPGMSGAIAEGDHIVWSHGFGLANREHGVAAEPGTIYPLASLTKPYASTIILQLVDEGRLDLDHPVSRFDISMDRSAPVRVWHLLSHTSGEPPGSRYRYDGNAFGVLTQVIERTAGQPFAREVATRIIRPLGLAETAPNPGDPHGFWSIVASLELTQADIEGGRASFAASGLERAPIQAALARGYARAWGRSIWPSGLVGPMRPMPHAFTLSTTAGLVASAPDVARFSMALDEGRLLSAASRERAWRPVIGANRRTLPYALGWFVQVSRGYRVVWHYGHALESSSLIVKIPDQRLTFVILANSDGLSRNRRLGDLADVAASPAATLFLNWSSQRK